MKNSNQTITLLPKKRYIPFSEKNVPIRMDEVFKIVMSKPETREFLKEFLEAILDRNINKISSVETEKLLDRDYKNLKNMKLDLFVQFENGEKLDVEIQNTNEKNIFQRSLAYSSGILYNSYKKSEKYIKENQAIIWIMDFNLYNESKMYHEIYTYKNKDSSDEKHFIEHHFIQLPKFIEQVKVIKTEKEKWLAYFSGQLNPIEKEELFRMSRSIKEINEIVDAVLTDPDVEAVLRAKEARIIERNLDREAGYLDGIEEGERKEKIEIAEKLLKEGMAISQIIKVTGLSLKEIEDLMPKPAA